MRSKLLYISIFFIASKGIAQENISRKIDASVQNFLQTTKGKVANISYHLTDEKGNVIYQYQAEKGLTTASTQKIFTAGATLEMLSPEYRYRTTVAHDGTIQNGTLHGNIIVFGSGDPTFGSWRYEETKPEIIFSKILNAINQMGIKKITGDIFIDDANADFQTIPGGWAWNDLGNYYGAGVFGLNWRENQFDIYMKNGKIQAFSYPLEGISWVNEIQIAGNKDQSIIYTAPFSQVAYINGNLPNTEIKISGATPNPPIQFATELKNFLQKQNIDIDGKTQTHSLLKIQGKEKKNPPNITKIIEIYSPTLREMVKLFLQKSINLYGEAFIKTLAKEQQKMPTYQNGVALLKSFWTSKGIASEMINFADGSGLSPQNYVSAKAEVQAILYAQKQTWFQDFFQGFPIQNNGMKMKSGTMKNTKSFAGIHTSKTGKRYIFAIILNNYQGNDASQVLFNLLKPIQ